MREWNGKRIYLSPPCLGGAELDYVKDAFDSNWIAPAGPHVSGFEADVAAHVGVSHSVGLSSGTAAIHLSLKAIDLRQDDRVFCSTFTFIGSCSSVVYEKAEPVFIDAEPDSWNMSPAALAAAMEWAAKENRLPKAVIIANIYGQSADYEALLPICRHYQVPVIEDAAESLGAVYRGRQSGSFGRLGVFSFNGNKIITTSGGGMVVSEEKEVIDRMRFQACQAKEPGPGYEHNEIGFNYRISNICAAIGRGQLPHLQDYIVRRKNIFEIGRAHV